jgi:hypothetical protein
MVIPPSDAVSVSQHEALDHGSTDPMLLFRHGNWNLCFSANVGHPLAPLPPPRQHICP